MAFVPFHQYFPELAEQETKVLHVVTPGHGDPPAGLYRLIELFCKDKRCDCRRAMLYVLPTTLVQPLAVVAFGWESREFYRRWFAGSAGGEMPELEEIVDEMQGPVLNLGSPQSRYAPALLSMIKEYALSDDAFMEQVQRHYTLFRQRLDPGRRGKPRKPSRSGKLR